MKPKILIVDDVPANLIAFEAILRDLDAELIKAESGFEALKLSLAHDFAAILMDVHMPEMDGFETAARMREHRRLQQTPLVFITADYQDDRKSSQGYAIGAFDFIYKPVSAEILCSKVNVYLQLARQTEQIREQVVVEARQRWEAQRMREELERDATFRLFVENVKDYAIFMIDTKGLITSWNETAVRIFGYEEHEILGREFRIIFTDEDDAAGCSEAELLKAETLGKAEDVRWHVKKDGSRFWADGLVTPLREPGGKILGFCKLLRDNTERKRWEEKLAETAAKLSRTNESLERFVHIVSHDLKEPLRTINSFLNLLRKKYRPELNSESAQFVQFAVDAAGRMRLLVDNLLTHYTRAGGGGEMRPVNLNEVVSKVIDDMKLTIEENSASVVHADLPEFLGDPVQMGQLFQNLVSNAIKFRSQEPPKIQIASERKDREWLVRVQDNGVGFDMDASKRIFEPLARLADVDAPGTGIGLSVCKEIVERHGGRIWVESVPGHGSVFHFTVPQSDLLAESV